MRTVRRMLAIGVVLATVVLGMLLATGTAGATNAEEGGGHALFVTRLTGEAELPGPGDEDGRGLAILVVDAESGKIAYRLRVRDIEPATAAHIHEIQTDGFGPVVAPLTAPTDGSSKGVVVDPALAHDILANPDDYYVNVHNAPFPNGAVRGDLG